MYQTTIRDVAPRPLSGGGGGRYRSVDAAAVRRSRPPSAGHVRGGSRDRSGLRGGRTGLPRQLRRVDGRAAGTGAGLVKGDVDHARWTSTVAGRPLRAGPRRRGVHRVDGAGDLPHARSPTRPEHVVGDVQPVVERRCASTNRVVPLREARFRLWLERGRGEVPWENVNHSNFVRPKSGHHARRRAGGSAVSDALYIPGAPKREPRGRGGEGRQSEIRRPWPSEQTVSFEGPAVPSASGCCPMALAFLSRVPASAGSDKGRPFCGNRIPRGRVVILVRCACGQWHRRTESGQNPAPVRVRPGGLLESRPEIAHGFGHDHAPGVHGIPLGTRLLSEVGGLRTELHASASPLGGPSAGHAVYSNRCQQTCGRIRGEAATSQSPRRSTIRNPDAVGLEPIAPSSAVVTAAPVQQSGSSASACAAAQGIEPPANPGRSQLQILRRRWGAPNQSTRHDQGLRGVPAAAGLHGDWQRCQPAAAA